MMKKRDTLLLISCKNLFAVFLMLLLGCYSASSKKKLEIEKDPAYPRWLKSRNYSTDQTSGIIFIGLDTIEIKGNRSEVKDFLLADDMGKIHRLQIKDDTLFSLFPVTLSENVQQFLAPFPKWDFEEITYDKYTNSVYLSIEGNDPVFKKYVGIYKINFSHNNIFSDTVSGINKLNIQPEDLFLKYTANNIGYEGLGVDKNYFYLGLEGFEESGIFGDSTFIFIVDKKNLKIIKQLNTKSWGIHTVCGLYADKNKSVFGIDRNMKQLFHLVLDDSFNVQDFSITDIRTNIPGYPSFDYVASLESVTKDNENNIYLVDDPWRTFYVPAERILDKMNNLSINNFKNFVPIIYKFKLRE